MTLEEAVEFCRQNHASVQWETYVRDLGSEGVVASCFKGDQFLEVVGRDFIEAIERLRALISNA